jgi:superfamily II DNA/RNA helicase
MLRQIHIRPADVRAPAPKRDTLSDTIQPEEIDADAKIDVTFTELGLDPKILKALDDLGYVTPTPIQAKAIPAALQQRDVLGIAQTGTGKTGAFTLPTMHKLAKGRARAHAALHYCLPNTRTRGSSR